MSVKKQLCLSGREDLNLRPFGPEPNALPDCATPRTIIFDLEAGRAEPQLTFPRRQGRKN